MQQKCAYARHDVCVEHFLTSSQSLSEIERLREKWSTQIFGAYASFVHEARGSIVWSSAVEWCVSDWYAAGEDVSTLSLASEAVVSKSSPPQWNNPTQTHEWWLWIAEESTIAFSLTDKSETLLTVVKNITKLLKKRVDEFEATPANNIIVAPRKLCLVLHCLSPKY